MITDTELDDLLDEAFSAFERLPADTPTMPEAATGSKSPNSARRLVAAAAALIAVGTGVLGLSQIRQSEVRVSTPTAAVPATDDGRGGADPASVPTSTISDLVEPDDLSVEDAPYRCDGLIGLRGDDRIYDECGPEMEYGIVDFVCTGLVGTDSDGHAAFTTCEPIAATSNVPGINSLPASDVAGPPGVWESIGPLEVTIYAVRQGDTPVEVATAHCLVLGHFAALNDDVDGFSSFLVGTEVFVQRLDDDGTCRYVTERSYTVEAGDHPVAVATRFCVPVSNLIAYNGWDSAVDFPFPGSLVLIPPGSGNGPDC